MVPMVPSPGFVAALYTDGLESLVIPQVPVIIIIFAISSSC